MRGEGGLLELRGRAGAALAGGEGGVGGGVGVQVVRGARSTRSGGDPMPCGGHSPRGSCSPVYSTANQLISLDSLFSQISNNIPTTEPIETGVKNDIL